MARYPSPTTINASEGIQAIYGYVNNVTNSWFSNLILIAFYIIIALSVFNYKKFSDGAFFEAVAIAGFMTAVVGILFWIAGFISGVTLTFVIVVAVLSFASLWLR